MSLFASGFALLLAALQGDVYVADAGTLVISGQPIQLSGVDIPAPGDPRGDRARSEVQRIIDGKIVTCRTTGDTYQGRMLAICRAGGDDIAELLVARGLVLDCPRHSNGAYREHEPQDARDRLFASAHCQH